MWHIYEELEGGGTYTEIDAIFGAGGAGVGVRTIEGDGVGVAVVDADADAEVVVFAVVTVVDAALGAACGALLAAWVLLVDDVQPAIDNEATITSTMIANNFFPYLPGQL